MDVASHDVMSCGGVLVFAELIIRIGMKTGTRGKAAGPALAVPLTHEVVNVYSKIFIRSRWSRGFSLYHQAASS